MAAGGLIAFTMAMLYGTMIVCLYVAKGIY